jgi:AmmeMemoRadiSam system protein A
MELTKDERNVLKTLAIDAVAAAVAGGPAPRPGLAGVLAETRGCFVTLTNRGRLRGCIGVFEAPRPLGEMIVHMARAAAREDPRFLGDPITVEELPMLDVEVSVLTPLTETDDPASLELGVDGIYIVGANGRSGCFLPEVATDAGWDVETFLSQCCLGKAGLPADAWKDPSTTVYLFRSEKF